MSDLELSFSGWRFTLKYAESSLFGVVHPGRVSICFGGPCGVLVLGVPALFWYLSVLVLKAARMDSSSAGRRSLHTPFSRSLAAEIFRTWLVIPPCFGSLGMWRLKPARLVLYCH